MVIYSSKKAQNKQTNTNIVMPTNLSLQNIDAKVVTSIFCTDMDIFSYSGFAWCLSVKQDIPNMVICGTQLHLLAIQTIYEGQHIKRHEPNQLVSDRGRTEALHQDPV